MQVTADYHQSDDGTLNLPLNRAAEPALIITGDAELGGHLEITIGKDHKSASGVGFTVLTANRIHGTFANADDEVVASDGSRFVIRYSESAVSLVAK